MANFTTIHTSTCITTSVDLVRRQSFLGFVPRVVILAVIVALPLGVLVEGYGLRRLFKVCFGALRVSTQFHSVRNTFTGAGSKAAVTAKSLVLENDRMVSLRSWLHHRGFTPIMV